MAKSLFWSEALPCFGRAFPIRKSFGYGINVIWLDRLKICELFYAFILDQD